MKTIKHKENILISRARMALTNTRNDEKILKAVKEYGYDDERLKEGEKLLSDSESKIQTKKEESAETKSKKITLDEAFESSHSAYTEIIKIARIAFRGNDKLITLLKLNGLRKRTIEEHTEEANLFYKISLNSQEILDGFKKFGQTKEKIEKIYDLLKQFIALNSEISIEHGDDVLLTKEKNTKLQEFERWFKDYEDILEIALKDQPEQLKKVLPYKY